MGCQKKVETKADKHLYLIRSALLNAERNSDFEKPLRLNTLFAYLARYMLIALG